MLNCFVVCTEQQHLIQDAKQIQISSLNQTLKKAKSIDFFYSSTFNAQIGFPRELIYQII